MNNIIKKYTDKLNNEEIDVTYAFDYEPNKNFNDMNHFIKINYKYRFHYMSRDFIFKIKVNDFNIQYIDYILDSCKKYVKILNKKYLVSFKINKTTDADKMKLYVKEEKDLTKLLEEWRDAFKDNIKLVLIDGFKMEF